MQSQGMYICSELVKIGKTSGEVTIRQSVSTYEATWIARVGRHKNRPFAACRSPVPPRTGRRIIASTVLLNILNGLACKFSSIRLMMVRTSMVTWCSTFETTNGKWKYVGLA